VTASGFRRLAVRGALAGAVAAGVAAAPARAQLEAGIPVGSRAPVITVPDLEGRPVDLGRYIGRQPVLIEFWASWCSLCRALQPQLEQIRATHGDRVAMVGINITVNDSRERVRRYLERHRPPFITLYDTEGVGSRAYDVPTTSFVVVINAAGEVVYTGSGDDQDLVGAVARALR
jgi:thiol-disulfide isomerase/thioredoxin